MHKYPLVCKQDDSMHCAEGWKFQVNPYAAASGKQSTRPSTINF